MESAAQIVRALVDAGDPGKRGLCMLCGAMRYEPHEHTCPWLRACAWVLAHPRPMRRHPRLPALRG